MNCAEWNDNCRSGGQCFEMLYTFESLISGEGCRSFFYTGKCSRLCTFSVRSLLGRQKWSRCSDRCEWPQALVEGADEWLQMCVSKPADDVYENHDEKEKNHTNTEDNIDTEPHTARLSVLTNRVWDFNALIFVLIFVCFGAIVLIASRPELRKRIQRSARRTGSWVKMMKENGLQGRAKQGRSTLDIGPDRSELRNLQRGARRHLKAIRSTLD